MTELARLTHSVPTVRLIWSLGGLVWCLTTGAQAHDWSNDRVFSEAIGPTLESLPKPAQQALKLYSQVLLRYSRMPNWWSICLIPVGYLPLSFRVSVECQMTILVSSPTGIRRFSAAVKTKRIVWGQAPNPARPTQDQNYESMEAEARKTAARLVADQVAAWLKHEGL